MKALLLVILLAGCSTAPLDGAQRCVMAPLGNNAAGALVILMRCRAEGEKA